MLDDIGHRVRKKLLHLNGIVVHAVHKLARGAFRNARKRHFLYLCEYRFAQTDYDTAARIDERAVSEYEKNVRHELYNGDRRNDGGKLPQDDAAGIGCFYEIVNDNAVDLGDQHIDRGYNEEKNH